MPRAALFSILLLLASLALTGVMLAQNPATIPVAGTAGWWMDRHQFKLQQGRSMQVDLLFVGDSITMNYELSAPPAGQNFLPIWQQYFAPHHAFNLGFSGDRTENVLWRLQHGEVDGLHPKDIVLLIGTNNIGAGQTWQDTTAGTIAIVDELHQRLPAARILILGILPTGGAQARQSANDQVNAHVRSHFAHASYTRFLDLSPIFLKDAAVDSSLYYDPLLNPPRAALHPNTEGQRRMAQAVAAALFPAPRPAH